MKPKARSPQQPPAVASRRPPALKQLTSTLTKPASPALGPTLRPRQVVTAKLARQKKAAAGDISGISPIRDPVPGITVSVCQDSTQPVIRDTVRPPPKKVTVLRSKVKSPVNMIRTMPRSKVKSPVNTISINRRETFIKRPGRVEELEQLVGRKDAELVSLTRRLNNTQKSLVEKERLVKDLEGRIPNMLKDLKKSLETDETKKMLLSRDLRENSKRIRNLSGSQKKIQDQLKIKEDKLKDAIEDKKKFEVEVKTWQKECREAAQRTGGLERKVAELQGRLAGSDQHLERERLRRTNLQLSCNKLINENNMKDEFVEKLKTEVFHFSNVASSRESEFKDLQRQNNELRRVIENQSRRMSQLSRREEVQQVQQAGGRSGAGELDRATEDFLDRVSTVSRDRNVSVNLKLLVRKSRRSSVADQSRVLAGSCGPAEGSTACSASVLTELHDNVFEEDAEVEDDNELFEDDSEMVGEETSESIAESSNYSVPSSGTFRRLEDLDEKLEGFWSKLSVEQNTVDSLMQEQAQFSLSVSRLERDLDQSALRHSCLLNRAGAVKRLFH